MKAFVAILVLAFVLAVSEACTCMFRHTQDHFCSSDFVVKATVVKGKYKLPRPSTTEATPATTTTSNAPTSAGTNNELLWEEEEEEKEVEAQEPVKRPPAGFLGGLAAPLGLNTFPGLGAKPADSTREQWPLKYKYTVQVEKIFKGDSFFTVKEKAVITTPADEGMCGLTGLTEGVSYLLTGRHYNGKLSIGLCDWATPYLSLTRIQKRGVKMLYKRQCSECQINTCYGGACMYANPDSNTCMLNMSRMWDSCEVQHSYCSKSKDSCKWQRNRDYKQCLLGSKGGPGRKAFIP